MEAAFVSEILLYFKQTVQLVIQITLSCIPSPLHRQFSHKHELNYRICCQYGKHFTLLRDSVGCCGRWRLHLLRTAASHCAFCHIIHTKNAEINNAGQVVVMVRMLFGWKCGGEEEKHRAFSVPFKNVRRYWSCECSPNRTSVFGTGVTLPDRSGVSLAATTLWRLQLSSASKWSVWSLPGTYG